MNCGRCNHPCVETHVRVMGETDVACFYSWECQREECYIPISYPRKDNDQAWSTYSRACNCSKIGFAPALEFNPNPEVTVQNADHIVLQAGGTPTIHFDNSHNWGWYWADDYWHFVDGDKEVFKLYYTKK